MLIPGGAGFIGSWLVPQLLAAGHKVTVLDTLWFGDGCLPKSNGNLKVLKGDVRNKSQFARACNGKDAVIYLASISNNAMYARNYKVTHEVNAECFLDVILAANKVPKFIYASSLAVGDPTSDYAKDKLACELLLLSGVIVRAASVCGYSTHQRLDTTVNMMTHDACRKGVITVHGGDQMRTHVHIQDLCDFYSWALRADAKDVNGKVFNVVAESQSIMQTAKIVAEITDAKITTVPRSDDRSYTAPDTDYITKRTVADAVRDLKIKFDAGYWPDSQTNTIYQNVRDGLQ